MTTPSIDSLINLAAALITLVAVIVPIAYNIWRKAKEANTTDKIPSIIFAVLAFLSYGSGSIWLGFHGINMIIVALYFAGLICHFGYFLMQQSPIGRLSVVVLVYQSVLVVVTLQLYFADRFLSVLEKIVG